MTKTTLVNGIPMIHEDNGRLRPKFRKCGTLSTYALKESFVDRRAIGERGYAEMGIANDQETYYVKGFDNDLKFFFQDFDRRVDADKFLHKMTR